MFGLHLKYRVFREITVVATRTKRSIYKEQATEYFKEASALNINAAIFDLKKQILQGYVQLDGLRKHPLDLTPNFGPFWKSTANNIFQSSQTLRHYLPLCYE
jgi:hypothetical protein